MNPNTLALLNEAYRNGVYTEETLSEEILSEEELADITQWVESLVQEGYDLDQFSDEELYAAYLEEAKGEGPEHAKPGTKTYQSVFRGYKPKSPSEKEAMHRGSGSKAKRRADNMEESVDLYDIVSEYLVSEGFCDSHEDADVIMANMSEEWRESIVNTLIEEGFVSPYKAPHAQGRSMDNTGRLSPAMKAMDKSDELQRTQPGSERQKMQTRRSNQLNKMFSAARRA